MDRTRNAIVGPVGQGPGWCTFDSVTGDAGFSQRSPSKNDGTVRYYRRLRNLKEPPELGERWDPAPLGWGRGWPPENKPPPHMCCHVKFGSSASKGVWREPQKLGERWAHRSIAIGAWLTPRNTLLHHTCYLAEFDRNARCKIILCVFMRAIYWCRLGDIEHFS